MILSISRKVYNEFMKNGNVRKMLTTLSAFAAACCIWLPNVHRAYKVAISDYFSENGIAEKTHRIAQWHREVWSDPLRRTDALKQMQLRNPEWDFMTRTYLVLSFTSMALSEPDFTAQALEIVDTIINNTLNLEQKRGHEYFLMGYGRSNFWNKSSCTAVRSIFVDGEIALMMAARRLVEEHHGYAADMKQRVELMMHQMKKSPVLCGESYPDECWMFCNSVAVAAIALEDVLDTAGNDGFIQAWLHQAETRLTHKETGLLISAFDRNGKPASVGFGPEGSSIWMVSHMLKFVDSSYALDQYQRAKKELGRNFLGFGYSREWPVSAVGQPDIDSGPDIPFLKASASASGLAILAASTFCDTTYIRELLTTLRYAGFPESKNGTVRFCASNPVGDAVLLYSLVQGPLLREAQSRRGAL